MCSLIHTIMGAWLIGRICDAFDLWYPVDVVTVYFLIGQVMFMISKWDYLELQPVSGIVYRGRLCLVMACIAFIGHDLALRYLPLWFRFYLFWLYATIDM